jgi:hypothetical protein
MQVVDKGLQIFIVVLFSVLGMAIVVLAWVQPMLVAERIITTFIGLVGISWVLLRVLLMRSAKARK